MVKISIASTYYNDKNMAKKVMDSVLSQTYANIEHVIVDGGSTDGTVELIKEYEEKYKLAGKKLVWISEKCKLYEGFNKALNMTKGEYVICGTDPYINNSVIEKIMSVLTEYNADYVYGGMLYQRDGKIIRRWSGKGSPKLWRFGWMAATPTLCIKRTIWEKYGPFDVNLKSASDYDFQISLFKDKTLSSKYIPQQLVLYYAGGTSNGTLKRKIQSIEECQYILKKQGVKFAWFTNLCKTIVAVFAYLFSSRKTVELNRYEINC